MLKHILMSGDSARHLIDAIAQISHQKITFIFSDITRLWLEYAGQEKLDRIGLAGRAPVSYAHNPSTVPIDVDETFCDREQRRLFQKVLYVDVAIYNIIKFCTKVAHCSAILRQGILEAGVLSLVLVAFANAEFHLSALTRALEKQRRKKSLVEAGSSSEHSLAPLAAAINDDASTLTVLIQYPSFLESWSDEQIRMRRLLGSSLVDALLGNLADIDEKYVWTRALFRKF